MGKAGALNDMYKENAYWRGLAGDNESSLNDVKKEYLRSQGREGALNNMEKDYWSS